jgi:prepilin peptidase CpaA
VLIEIDAPGVTKAAQAVALALVVACAVFDWRSRRIPNALTLPAIVAGLALHGVFGGLSGIAFSLKGLALGAGLFLIPFFLGGMGAGDVKLMGAVGALLGWHLTLAALIYTAIVGGLVAMLAILRAKAVKRSFARMGSMFQILFASMRFPSADSLEGDSVRIPYALPIALGTAAALFLGWPA